MKTEKIKIEEIVVVEGKNDTKRLQQFFDVDTIETIGSAINEEILAQIQHAADVRGVIVLTDPDFAGEKIRKTIMEEVPEAKHAFIYKSQGVPKRTKKKSLGVEHADRQALFDALSSVMTPATQQDDFVEISLNQLMDLGLIAGAKAKFYRRLLGEKLRIGYVNGKQLQKRMAMFKISEEELMKTLQEIREELS